MSRVRTLGAALAGRRRSEIEKPRGPRTAPDRAKGLEEDGAGEEESVVFSNIKVRVKRAGPSGLGDLDRTAYLSTWQRLKQASCLTNSCTSHMLTVFNQIPLHVHAVFCYNNYYNYCFSITCIYIWREA